jgi:DNA polymerase I-like protein with 3'-5' exonuclease and polymerase domains
MTKGFDPHLTIAVIAGLVSQEDADWYVWYKGQEIHNVFDDDRFARIDEIRAVGKSTNYACQYGAGVKTIARTAKVSERIAKKLHEAYHKMNWSIAKIASMMTVKKTDFGMWQLNPINKMWYSLRSDKDRFSTLIQVLEIDEDMQDEYKQLVADGLQKVNGQLKLNRELACDIKFGKRYSDIH